MEFIISKWEWQRAKQKVCRKIYTEAFSELKLTLEILVI